jgi:ppGpp synthetase/RelA/SpoT-type nucleotidyltranferase
MWSGIYMSLEEKIEKFSNEYERTKSNYRDFCASITQILKSLLNKHSFQYQVISNRVKDFHSIEGKLLNGSLTEEVQNLNEIDDIAGCRIIFYLESDIQKFSNLIYNEFTVNKHNLRYSEEQYNALHLVIRHKPDRLKLMEYESFEGLKCELQLTTVLFHAWSEMSHNIIYKLPEELKEFDEQAIQGLNKQFEEVMKNHIKPASYSFEFIYERFHLLKQGKKIFDMDFLQSISHSRSRNEIYEKLKLLNKFLREFGDKTPEGINLIEFIPAVIQLSKGMKTEDVDTALGSFYGYEHSDVVIACLDILNQIRYSYIEELFLILMKLSNINDRKIKDKVIESLNMLSKFNLNIIENYGYVVQLKIIKIVKELPESAKLEYWSFIENLFKNLSNLEFNDLTMSDYNQVSITSGTIGHNSHLDELRMDVLNISKEIFGSATDINIRVGVIKVLGYLIQLPRRDNYDPKIEELVSKNIIEISVWLLSVIEELQLLEVKSIEGSITRYSTTKEYEPLELLKEKIKNNKEYNIFKVLVGFDTSFGNDIGWREARKFRNTRIDEYISDITDTTFEVWENRIISIAKFYSPSHDGEYINFKNFLIKLGEKKPKILYKMLINNTEPLGSFISNVVAGIIKSTSEDIKNTVYNQLETWVKNNNYLEQIANVFYLVDSPDITILEQIYFVGKEKGNYNALQYSKSNFN